MPQRPAISPAPAEKAVAALEDDWGEQTLLVPPNASDPGCSEEVAVYVAKQFDAMMPALVEKLSQTICERLEAHSNIEVTRAVPMHEGDKPLAAGPRPVLLQCSEGDASLGSNPVGLADQVADQVLRQVTLQLDARLPTLVERITQSICERVTEQVRLQTDGLLTAASDLAKVYTTHRCCACARSCSAEYDASTTKDSTRAGTEDAPAAGSSDVRSPFTNKLSAAEKAPGSGPSSPESGRDQAASIVSQVSWEYAAPDEELLAEDLVASIMSEQLRAVQ